MTTVEQIDYMIQSLQVAKDEIEYAEMIPNKSTLLCGNGDKMIRERYLISKNDLDKVNNLIESIEILSRTLMERPDSVNVELYAERIHSAVNSIQNFLIVGETWD